MTMTSSVRVAVRVRPLTEQERQQQSQHHPNNGCVVGFVPNQPQIIVDQERSFTFDYAYQPLTSQKEVYATCVVPLLNKFLDGYNSTILAYGQTGSGKTYSMGIGLESASDPNSLGIVPRFIQDLFENLQSKVGPGYSFEVSVSFLELYNEEIIDLFSPYKGRSSLTIMEDGQGNIRWHGVREEAVTSPEELFSFLQKGSNKRTTAATDMNHTSSRSHAIFSVSLKQFIRQEFKDRPPNVRASYSESCLKSQEAVLSDDYVTNKVLLSKFHFVDLAGSERLKRTNAVGDRAKEGISINSGLLALGNVISALGDESRRVSHIPYRDSKLTRLLQDSLGGNSQTLMLACVSPAAINVAETLDTLKYANRARNIRNRVVINQEIGDHKRLKSQVAQLKEELRGNDEFLKAVNDEMDTLKSEKQQLEAELTQTKRERDQLRVMLSRKRTDGHPKADHSRIIGQDDRHSHESVLEPVKSRQASPILEKDDDDMATLVATSNRASKEIVDKAAIDRKKKRHSYRFGSRRSVKGRRRLSISMLSNSGNSQPGTPRAIPRAINHQKATTWRSIKQSKADLHEEIDFLGAIKASLDTMSDLERGPNAVRYAGNLTVDHVLPVSVPHGRSSETHTYPPARSPAAQDALLRKVMQKFHTCLQGKQLLIVQLERLEQQKTDLCQQYDCKISELNTKRTETTTGHKKELTRLEVKNKKQFNELQALKQKHTQLSSSVALTRSQHETSMRRLQQKTDELKLEKKRLMKRMKQERDKRSNESPPTPAPQLSESQLPRRSAATPKQPPSRRASEDLTPPVKQAASLLKKALASDHIDRALVSKALECMGHRPVSVRHDKKDPSRNTTGILNQIQQAVSMYAQEQAPLREIGALETKLDMLSKEQQQLLDERVLVLKDECQRLGPDAHVDESLPQYMDERIDTITAEICFLITQIERLKLQTVKTGRKSNTGLKASMDSTTSLLRSLNHVEALAVAQALLEDLVELKSGQLTSNTFIEHMDHAMQRLHRGLIQIRHIAKAYDQELTTVDAACSQALLGHLHTRHGLLLPNNSSLYLHSQDTPASLCIEPSKSLTVYPPLVR